MEQERRKLKKMKKAKKSQKRSLSSPDSEINFRDENRRVSAPVEHSDARAGRETDMQASQASGYSSATGRLCPSEDGVYEKFGSLSLEPSNGSVVDFDSGGTVLQSPQNSGLLPTVSGALATAKPSAARPVTAEFRYSYRDASVFESVDLPLKPKAESRLQRIDYGAHRGRSYSGKRRKPNSLNIPRHRSEVESSESNQYEELWTSTSGPPDPASLATAAHLTHSSTSSTRSAMSPSAATPLTRSSTSSTSRSATSPSASTRFTRSSTSGSSRSAMSPSATTFTRSSTSSTSRSVISPLATYSSSDVVQGALGSALDIANAIAGAELNTNEEEEEGAAGGTDRTLLVPSVKPKRRY